MSGAPTIGALKRLSFIPDNDNVGHLIAGQNYFDVWFTGGTAQNLNLINCTLIPSGGGSGVSSLVHPTSGLTATAPLNSICLFDSAAIGNKTVNIPASTGTYNQIIIGDKKGNAASDTNQITPVPASGSIINASAAVVYTPGGSVTLIDTPLGWWSE